MLGLVGGECVLVGLGRGGGVDGWGSEGGCCCHHFHFVLVSSPTLGGVQ
jgi:hypothetical protein